MVENGDGNVHDATHDILRKIQADIAAFRKEVSDRFEKSEADTGRVHADVAQVKATATQMHADVLATKSVALDVVVKLTNPGRTADAHPEGWAA
jgi:hypothetical protein